MQGVLEYLHETGCFLRSLRCAYRDALFILSYPRPACSINGTIVPLEGKMLKGLPELSEEGHGIPQLAEPPLLAFLQQLGLNLTSRGSCFHGMNTDQARGQCFWDSQYCAMLEPLPLDGAGDGVCGSSAHTTTEGYPEQPVVGFASAKCEGRGQECIDVSRDGVKHRVAAPRRVRVNTTAGNGGMMKSATVAARAAARGAPAYIVALRDSGARRV